MAKAERSGITVTAADVPTIFGMINRGDRRHDVAAWFGLNQGRIKEVEDGVHGHPAPAPPNGLPPSGSPGPKALSLRRAIGKAIAALQQSKSPDAAHLLVDLTNAVAQFDKNE
jgi:hypothetical protein